MSDVNIEQKHERVHHTIDDLYIEAVLLVSEIKRHKSIQSGGVKEKFNKFFPCFNALFLLTRWDKKMKEKTINEDEKLVDVISAWIDSVVNGHVNIMNGVELFEKYAGALNDTGIISRG